ncbi:hypothetical protein [Bradyrhizobium betae]|uniref:hypothetical protein n=1 Tax=Bradyrhizobium betae TaxID=244734 RepID=UPI00100ECC81|nr:hypothetical protein [Bradyrhizobium betae]
MRSAKPPHPFRVGDRLLDEIEPGINQRRRQIGCARVPGLVEVEADAGPVGKRALDGGDMRDAAMRIAVSDK